MIIITVSLFSGMLKRSMKGSGGVCRYCGYGNGKQPDFDLWRQLSIEHIIGKSQGGDKKHIREAVQKRFPELDKSAMKDTVDRILRKKHYYRLPSL